MENNNNYYVILSRWNSEGAKEMIHTFMIDNDSRYSKKYHAYNYNCNKEYENIKYTKDVYNYSSYFERSISKTYICAYFVSK